MNEMKKRNYDDTSIDSILRYAKGLEGLSITDILQGTTKKIDVKNKGAIGTIIEEYYFGIKPNSSPEPDFYKVGVELKIIPLVQQLKKIAIKERTKICSINYETLVFENWDSSHAKKKLNKILFIYYLYDKTNLANSCVKKVALWELEHESSKIIIQNDWQETKQKVLDGYAHELSEKYFKILSPARSGSGGVDKNGRLKDLVPQPNTLHQTEALKRAFTLKQSFTNQIWYALNKQKYESIIESLHIQNLEEFKPKILDKLYQLEGKSLEEIAELFHIKIPQGKNQVATIVKKAIGFKNVQAKIKEFEQLGIVIKTIKVRRKDLMPFEAVSFSAIKLQRFEKESFEESDFYQNMNEILFVPIIHDGRCLKEKYFSKAFFFRPNSQELSEIKKEWQMYQKEVLSGKCQVSQVKNNSKRGYKEVSQLSKESQTNIIHMRPHARDANDRDIDSFGNSIVKHSFWLNKKFIHALLQKEL